MKTLQNLKVIQELTVVKKNNTSVKLCEAMFHLCVTLCGRCSGVRKCWDISLGLIEIHQNAIWRYLTSGSLHVSSFFRRAESSSCTWSCASSTRATWECDLVRSACPSATTECYVWSCPVSTLKGWRLNPLLSTTKTNRKAQYSTIKHMIPKSLRCSYHFLLLNSLLNLGMVSSRVSGCPLPPGRGSTTKMRIRSASPTWGRLRAPKVGHQHQKGKNVQQKHSDVHIIYHYISAIVFFGI